MPNQFKSIPKLACIENDLFAKTDFQMHVLELQGRAGVAEQLVQAVLLLQLLLCLLAELAPAWAALGASQGTGMHRGTLSCPGPCPGHKITQMSHTQPQSSAQVRAPGCELYI